MSIAAVEQGALSLPSNMALPAYLKERKGEAPKGIETLKEYFVPPRIKVIQAMSDDSLKALFGEGSVIVVPQNLPIAPMIPPQAGQPAMGTPFTFIPILHYTEWGIVNPRGVQGLNFLRERTNDPGSVIAKRARDWKTPGIREEPCPEDNSKIMRYQEFINFICVIEGISDLAMMLVLFSFWSTAHSDGRNLANLTMSRNADIFALRFEGVVTKRRNQKGNWWGLTIKNPTANSPYVQDEERYLRSREMHEQFAKMRGDDTLRAEYDEVMEAESRDVTSEY